MSVILDASTRVSLDAATDVTRKTRKIYDYALGCVVERYEDEIEQELNEMRGFGIFQAGA